MACATTSSILFWRPPTDPDRFLKNACSPKPCLTVTQVPLTLRIKMDPEPRKKQLANIKKKDKGNPYASQKHVRIELENQYRHWKRINAPDPT